MNVLGHNEFQSSTGALLAVRQAQPEDAMDVLRWRNDSHTRGMSRSCGLIAEKEHRTWFGQALRDPDCCLIIGEHLGVSVGMVRFNRGQGDEWEISINVAPEMRGKGLGKKLLTAALSHFAVEHPDASLSAEIRSLNMASKHLFESMGFSLVSCIGDIFHYTRQPPSP